MQTREPAAEREAQRKAIARAMARGGAALVTRVRHGRYKVASNSRGGRFHTVTVDAQGRYLCDCEAALSGRVCWAQACVYLAKLEHNGRVRVTALAPAPPPAARTPRKEVSLT